MVPARRPYDPDKPWLVNATGLPEEQTFQAIIAETTCDDHPKVLLAGEFLKDDPLYHIDTGTKILRTAKELAACAKPLLKVSEELQLVDPNFKVRDHFSRPVNRFLATLEEILRLRVEMPHPLRKLELHLQRRDDQSSGHTPRLREKPGPGHPHRPCGQSVSVERQAGRREAAPAFPAYRIRRDQGCDYGLDEGEKGEQTEVALVPDNLWKKYRQDYSESGTAFAIEPARDIFVVNGS